MVAQAIPTTPDHEFVGPFNSSLAEAKFQALALLSAIVAGAETGEVSKLRERRLAASQVLRTPFLRVDDDGHIVEDRRRSGSRRRRDMGLQGATHGTHKRNGVDSETGDGSDGLTAHSVRGSSSTPSASPAALREILAVQMNDGLRPGLMNPLRSRLVPGPPLPSGPGEAAIATLRASPRAPV